jgi:hypothetical protein
VAAINEGRIEKVDRGALPAGVTVDHQTHTTLSDTFTITADAPFVLRVLTFYWPGWTASLDGQPVPIHATDPEGFIAVSIPSGSHRLHLRLRDTPPRQLGWALSATTLLLLAGLLWRASWPRAHSAPSPALPSRLAATLAALAIAAVLVRVGADAVLRWQAAHRVPFVPQAQTQHYAPFDNGLALVAYSFPQPQARPGEPVTLTLYWMVTQPMSRPASVFVHFYGPDGQLWGQADKPDPVEFYPTTRWALGRVTQDVEIAVLRADAPPGAYSVAVGLWDRATGQRAQPLDPTGHPTDQDKLTLTTDFLLLPASTK